MSREVPEGWEERKVGDLISESRVKGSTGQSAKKMTVKLYGKGVFEKKERRQGSKHTQYFKRSAGQFIYSKLDFLNGAFGVIPSNLDGFETTTDLPCFNISENVDSSWFLLYISRPDFYKKLSGTGTGGRKARRVSPSDFYKSLILFPPLPEQKKIAAILTSVDEVIENLQKQINKLQDLKKATMNELLNKGIGHTEFKDSELGRIPKSWVITRINQIIIDISDGGTPSTRKPEYFGGHIPWVVIDDIKPKIYKTATFITELGLKKSSAKRWNAGTIILSTGATIGQVGIAMKPMATKQGICGIIPKNDVDTNYLYHYFVSIKFELNILSQGSTIKEVRPPAIKKIRLRLPPPQEQKKSAAILTSIDNQLGATMEKLRQTQSLKNSLMQDLLAGRRRVLVEQSLQSDKQAHQS